MAEQMDTMQDDAPETNLIGDEDQVVVFRLAEEEFGVNINSVKEIVRLPEITPIPRTPDYVSGICNLRGSVLPVINSRIRFSMEEENITDHSRLLVVESRGQLTGMVVDSVREVMRMNRAQKESSPAVCKGVDREFLDGVLKVDQGRRLILMLDMKEVLSLDTASGQGTKNIASDAQAMQKEKKKAEIEEQLVSFKLAGDEYAFDIANVREILKISSVTSVPNVPSYVRGLFTIRNHLLPIIDMRELLGLPSMISERIEYLDQGFEEDANWVDNLRHVLESGSYFNSVRNAKASEFGQWIEAYKSTSIEVESVVKSLKKARADLCNSGMRALDMREKDKKAALSFLEENTRSYLKIVSDHLLRFKKVLEKHICEDQRALVVEVDSITVGFLVDWVDEVSRIPQSVIDETPAMAASDRKELRAVAKLEQGRRLIMIMDEKALLSSETSRVIKKLKKQNAEKEDTEDEMKSLARQSMDEVQLVTFNIAGEEYGIPIMQVQEINRASDITAVPRAPEFIDGMTNLRGNVIPVISIRNLFDLEDTEVSDRTRIIIVDIGGSKTGLRVDGVNEVLRLSRQDIEVTPHVVTSAGANAFLEGVCKIDEGRRIVMLLNVEKILNENELQALENVGQRGQTGKKPSGSKKNTEDKTPAASGGKPKKSLKKKKLEIDE
ncbi:MAG: chemotaxis protein CheW [Desulfococcaceae bacterium]|jgi:purine-binding chemotaxis protein CheW|nr:chemotaxis protein CheW [Desulfococcaceae bacterium]